MNAFKLYIYGSGITQTFFGYDTDAIARVLMMANENKYRTVTLERDNVIIAYYCSRGDFFECESVSTGKVTRLSLDVF
jgi:hypothetical protein